MKNHTYLFTVKATGEQVKVRTSCPYGVSIITHSALISQEITNGITDIDMKIISNAIKKAKIFEFENDFRLTMKKHNVSHVDIIAKLVNLIQQHGCVPLWYETWYEISAFNKYKLKGHHSLHALRFINRHKDDFIIPIYLGGEMMSILERLFTPLECDYRQC